MLWLSQPSSAQNTDSLSKPPKTENYDYIGGWPVLAGLIGGSNLGLNSTLNLGHELSYGKVYNKVLIGTRVGYAHTWISSLKGSNQARWIIYSEYHFLPKRRVCPLAGFQAYAFLFQYSPQVNSYQFFNDPLDGVSRTRLMPGIKPYIGLDFLFRKKWHIVVSYGYDYKITNKPERIPITGKQGMDWNLEFRVPLHKKQMAK